MLWFTNLLKSYSRPRHDVDEGFDEGFSIVELVASLAVLAIGIVALLGTLVVAARAAGTQRGRLNAVLAANRAFEDIRARPYNQIALWPGDPDFALRPLTSTATETVTTDTAQNAIPVRRTPIVLAGVSYEIFQNVLWVPYLDPLTNQSYNRAYKLVVVRAAWSDHVGRHEIQLESYVYPGAQGKASTLQGCGSQVLQQPITALAEVWIPENPTIRITWRDRAQFECEYQIERLESAFDPVECGPQLTGWVSTATLSQDSEESFYPAAFGVLYCFRVRAVNESNRSNPDDGWVYTDPLQTPPPPADNCVISSPVVLSPAVQGATPNRIKVHASTGMNQDNIKFAISWSGNCTRIWAELTNRSGQVVNTGDFTLNQPQAFTIVGSNWQAFDLGYGDVVFKAEGSGNPDVAIQRVCFYKGGQGSSC